MTMTRVPRGTRRVSDEVFSSTVLPCVDCGLDKPAAAFRWRNKAKRVLTSQCRDCWNEWRAQHRVLHVEQTMLDTLDANLAKAFKNLHLPDGRPVLEIREDLRRRTRKNIALYATLLEEQGGRCVICGTDEPGGRGTFHIDHDHATNRFRGLLCHGCNTGLGAFGDDPDRLLQAAAYLLATASCPLTQEA